MDIYIYMDIYGYVYGYIWIYIYGYIWIYIYIYYKDYPLDFLMISRVLSESSPSRLRHRAEVFWQRLQEQLQSLTTFAHRCRSWGAQGPQGPQNPRCDHNLGGNQESIPIIVFGSVELWYN